MPRPSPLTVHALIDAAAYAPTVDARALPRERVRCVPSMFNSLGVKVPYPT